MKEKNAKLVNEIFYFSLIIHFYTLEIATYYIAILFSLPTDRLFTNRIEIQINFHLQRKQRDQR